MIALLKTLSELMRGRPIDAGRVFLRPPARGDWRSWAALRAESRAFLEPWEPAWSRDALTRKAFMRRLRAYGMNSQSDAGYSFFVFRRDDNALLGGVSLSHVRRGISQTASIGYWIGAPFAGRGYMTEALSGLLPFAFDRLCLHRVGASCMPHNLASRAVLKKVGFSEEGFARKYLRINGIWQDHVLYAMLDSDLRPALMHSVAAKEMPVRRFAAQVDRALAPARRAKLGPERG